MAVITARMKGWQTRTFTDKVYIHHRQMSTATQGALMVPFRGGRTDYILGSHPVWEFFRCVYQTTRPPLLIGGVLRLTGFLWAMISGEGRQVSAEIIAFRKKEQMARLRKLVTRS